MEEDTPFFDKLPEASFLEQVLQQQDQQQLLTRASLVCRKWHQLALRSLRSIEAAPQSVAAAEQLAAWLVNHGSALVSLTSLSVELAWGGWSQIVPEALVQAISGLDQLRSLSMWQSPSQNIFQYCTHLSISSLVHLTSLRLSKVRPAWDLLESSLPSLTQLQSLDLSHNSMDIVQPSFVRAVGSSLVQLRSLDFSGTDYYGEGKLEALVSLTALTCLQRLALSWVKAEELVKLQKLPITEVHINTDGGQGGLVTAWLKHNSSTRLRQLESLGLTTDIDNGLGEAEVADILSTLHAAAALRELIVYNVYALKPHRAQLDSMTQLTRLRVHNCGVLDIYRG